MKDLQGFGVAGYSGIERETQQDMGDTAGYSGIQRGTAGYSGIQRDTAGYNWYYKNVLQITG